MNVSALGLTLYLFFKISNWYCNITWRIRDKFNHLGRLYDVFQWPDTITVISFYEDPSKDCDINGDEPLLFFCLECHVLTSTEQFWGWSYEKWRLFLASEWWMVNHHCLTNLFFFLPQLKMYNDAIRLRIVTFHGDGFPTEGELCVSFLDRVSCRSTVHLVPVSGGVSGEISNQNSIVWLS